MKNKKYYDKKQGNKGNKGTPNTRDSKGKNKSYLDNENRVDDKRGGRAIQGKPEKAFEDEHSNDIIWWSGSPIYPLATSIQYNKMPGYVYAFSDFTNVSLESALDEAAMPGIVALRYYPTIGYADSGKDAVNIAFNNLFNDLIARTNSANVGFQSMDLALISLAVCSIIEQIGEIERALMFSNTYLYQNLNLPKGLIGAMGIEYDDLVENRANYVMRLQRSIMNFNSLSVVDFLSLYRRRMQLARNVYYEDETGLTGSLKLFKSMGWYRYMDTEGALYFNEYGDTPVTLAQRLTWLEDAINALVSSSDFGNIMGAVRRAFQQSALIGLDVFTGEEVPSIYFDRNVNWQINNATLLGPIKGLGVSQIPDQNRLVCQPKLVNLNYPQYIQNNHKDMVINSYDGEIGNEFIMEATRFTNNAFRGIADGTGIIYGCGTEIARDFEIYRARVYENEETGEKRIDFSRYIVEGVMALDNEGNCSTFNALSTIKYAPIIEAISERGGYAFGPHGDINVWTTISDMQLEYINIAALQSVYRILFSSNSN